MDLMAKVSGKLKAGIDRTGPCGSRRTIDVVESILGGIQPYLQSAGARV